MLRTRQQQEQQQRSASSTRVQQQTSEQNWSNYSFVHSDSPEPLDHIARMQAGVAVQQPALG